MKKILLVLLALQFALCFKASAQLEVLQDSIVQINGIIMSSDSLVGLGLASIVVKGQNRGTYTNEKGVFSIVVLKGEEIEISYVGYLTKYVTIPKNIPGNEYSLIQLLTQDTVYLPATIIKARPSREQFERDFINNLAPDDNITIARKNNSEAVRRFLAATMATDGREAGNRTLRNLSNRASYQGQAPPINVLNPAAWAEFVKAWKRGDYKKKK
jgi:hypothetical protein